MNIPSLFKGYIWLVNTIYRAHKISLAEINDRWVETDMSGGVEFARTTFNRYKDAIQDIFGIYIECDRKDGYRYYIGNRQTLQEDSLQNWMLSTLTVGNVLSESASMQNRILLEPISSDDSLLLTVIQAMKEYRKIQIIYHRYGASQTSCMLMDPYCVKLFHQRWYLVGKTEHGHLPILAFDRIEDIALQKSKFVMDKEFDANEYFSDSYGIVVSDETKVERIVLRAYGLEKYYLRDLPLHHSQREIADADDYADFECCVKPTADFKAKILSRGMWLEVLQPQGLADEICEWHQSAIDRYKKKR